MATRLDLATLDGLSEAVASDGPGSGQRLSSLGHFDGTFCASCGDERRMLLVCLFWEDRWAPGWQQMYPEGRRPTPPSDDPSPAVFVAVCVQCDSQLLLTVR